MENVYELFEFLEDDYAEANISRKRRRMHLREQYNPFNLDDEEFVKRYRLTKELARNLCDELRPQMNTPKRSSDLSVETKVLIALSFYATGSYQRPTGSNEGHYVAQQTVSAVIAEITACLNAPQIRNKYIKFPVTEEERNRIKTKFYNKYRIPGVLGCIDCTHIPIIRPVENEHNYFCCKHHYSLNVQLICDADMQIMSVDATQGGSKHDTYIWDEHPLKAHLEDLSKTEDIWLLGDSGYHLRKYIMTPIINPEPDSPQAYFTDLLVCAKKIIDDTIGVLKNRFRCLLMHKGLHYSPQVAGSIVSACVILHNICNRANIPVLQLSNYKAIQEAIQEAQLHLHEPAIEQEQRKDAYVHGLIARQHLVQLLWEKRRLSS